MSKVNKLRRAPRLFFQDASNPLVRRIGTALISALVKPDGSSPFLYDPVGTLADSSLPVVSSLARAKKARDQQHRNRVIEASEMPLVSIVMPAHNAARTVERALYSLQAQEYRNLEIIVVDDQSSDSTTEIVNRLMLEDSRIRLLTNRLGRGAALTRNIGMQSATGEFLTFQDADDTSSEDRIERQVAALLTNQRTIVSVCDYQRVDASGRPMEIDGRTIRRSIISMMFRREPVLSRMGYMQNLHVSEDAEFYERMKIVFGPECQHHIGRVMYLADFSESSLLFSDGTTRINGGGKVAHIRSADAQRALESVKTWHKSISESRSKPLVSLHGIHSE